MIRSVACSITMIGLLILVNHITVEALSIFVWGTLILSAVRWLRS